MEANTGEIKELPLDVRAVAKSLSVKRLGGVCLIQMCGNGETLLPSYIVELTRLLLEDGHCVFITTNGTLTDKIDRFLEFPAEHLQRLGFKFSYHYLELKRLNKLDVFFENANKIRAAGCSVDIEAGAFDDYADYAEEMKSLSFEKMGAYAHIADIHSGHPHYNRLTQRPIDEHFNTWEIFESPVFALQKELWMKPVEDFCYGGDWFLQVYLENGNLQPCIGGGDFIGNIYENIDEPMHFAAIGENCICPYCYSAQCYLAVGVVPAWNTPHYDKMRNRVLADGSEWLRPELRDIMHRKLNEANEEYSDNKKKFISALMREEYSGTIYANSHYQYSLAEIGAIVERSIRSAHGGGRMAIYGNNKLAVWLAGILSGTSVEVLLIDAIDASHTAPSRSLTAKLRNRFAYWLKAIKKTDSPIVLDIADKWPKLDAVVVSDYPKYETIKKMLTAQKGDIFTIPITELVP
jgi:hypothetical protein